MTTIKEILKAFVKKSYWLACIAYVIHDFYCGIKYAHGDLSTASGTTYTSLDLESSLEYIHKSFAMYKTLANVGRFFGNVAEVAPGNNAGISLLFVNDGCDHVDLVDRFKPITNNAKNERIYSALGARHPALSKLLSTPRNSHSETLPKISYQFGSHASAEEFFFRKPEQYDFIVSCAVLEHVADVERALCGMMSALKHGGTMIHIVDLRDHGMFSLRWHELKFLEVPSAIYPHMVSHSGRPNRTLLTQYKEIVSGLQGDFQILITSLAGVGEITPHTPYAVVPEAARLASLEYVESVRRRFARKIQRYSSEDLSVNGFALIGRKA